MTWSLVLSAAAAGVAVGFLAGASWTSRHAIHEKLERHVQRRLRVLCRLRQDLSSDGRATHGPDCARLELELLADRFGITTPTH